MENEGNAQAARGPRNEWTVVSGQKIEDGRQKAKGRSRKSEDRREKTEDRGREPPVTQWRVFGGQWTADRRQKKRTNMLLAFSERMFLSTRTQGCGRSGLTLGYIIRPRWGRIAMRAACRRVMRSSNPLGCSPMFWRRRGPLFRYGAVQRAARRPWP
jgi:hypothetical protein